MGYGYLGRALVVDLAGRTTSVRSVRDEVYRTIPPRITQLDRNEKIRHVPLEAFQRMLDEYYRLREWDPEGRPRPERQERLGLQPAEPVLAG